MRLTKIQIRKLAKAHTIISIGLLILAIIEKENNILLKSSLYRGVWSIYFIFGNLFYTIIFKVLYKTKNLLILKTTTGIENRVYYISSFITFCFIYFLLKYCYLHLFR